MSSCVFQPIPNESMNIVNKPFPLIELTRWWIRMIASRRWRCTATVWTTCCTRNRLRTRCVRRIGREYWILMGITWSYSRRRWRWTRSWPSRLRIGSNTRVWWWTILRKYFACIGSVSESEAWQPIIAIWSRRVSCWLGLHDIACWRCVWWWSNTEDIWTCQANSMQQSFSKLKSPTWFEPKLETYFTNKIFIWLGYHFPTDKVATQQWLFHLNTIQTDKRETEWF